MDARKAMFKKALDGDSCRRRREEQQVQIRKQKREESLSQRRRMDAQPLVAAAAGGTFGAPTVAAGAAPDTRVEDLPRFALDMRSGDVAREIEATRGVRKLLSVERKPPVEEVLNQGILPLLIGMLARDGAPPQLQFESAWALTNIASTAYTRTLVEHGATPHLARLLMSPSADVREQCAWALGNISGDCPELRDVVLNAQALGPLLKNVEQPASESMLKNCVWSLSNLCRGKPQPHLDVLRPALAVLAKVLATSKDPDCLQDAGWALSYISDGDNERIQAVIDAGVAPDLVRHLHHDLPSVITPMVRTLGNLVSGDDLQTQAVLDAGALLYMPALLRNSKKNIRKETCWLLSNIAAGNAQQVNALTLTKNLIGMVLGQMASAEWDVRKEAAWVISNVLTGCGPAHVQQLVELGVMKPLCDMLEVGETKMVEVALEALEAILRTGEETHAGYTNLFAEADGPEKLEKLQEHANDKIYRRAVEMIERYLGVDDDEEEGGGGDAYGGVGGVGGAGYGQNGTFGFQAAVPVPPAGAGGGFNFSNISS